jgi:exonuclease III
VTFTALIDWALGIMGTGILSGVAVIVKTTLTQSKALAVLVARVEPAIAHQAATMDHEARIVGLEGDMARIWNIYDSQRKETV